LMPSEPPPPTPTPLLLSSPSVDDVPIDSEGAHLPSPIPSPSPLSSPSSPPYFPSRLHCGTWMDGLAFDCHYTNGQWKTGFTCLLVLPQYALAVALSWAQHPPTIANVGPGHSPHHGAT
jgi:hypothetical protein